MTQYYETLREFRTKNFTVKVAATVDIDYDMSWLSPKERQDIYNGDLGIYLIRVQVIHRKLGEVGVDYLGGCVYNNIYDFVKERKSYFADMINTACADARDNIRGMTLPYVRNV